jgi:hypothetical protein
VVKFLVGAFFAAVNLLYASVFGGPIDGTSWDVRVKKDGFLHWASRRDTLVFEEGRAVVAGAIARGYGPALYDAKPEDGATAFTMRLRGPDRDPVVWTGRVEGRRISGVVVVNGRDGRVLRYVFTGARKDG